MTYSQTHEKELEQTLYFRQELIVDKLCELNLLQDI